MKEKFLFKTLLTKLQLAKEEVAQLKADNKKSSVKLRLKVMLVLKEARELKDKNRSVMQKILLNLQGDKNDCKQA